MIGGNHEASTGLNYLQVQEDLEALKVTQALTALEGWPKRPARKSGATSSSWESYRKRK